MNEQIIVCAAVKVHGVILCGARHWDKIMRKQMLYMNHDTPRNEEQGFIDQYGNFVNRVDALQIVLDNGQRFNMERNGSSTELFSEGLY